MNTNEFFSTSDGSLVRYLDGKTVRENYALTHRRIDNGVELRSTLRNGAFAWPGGYPLHLLTSDGEVLCFDCGHKEFPQIARAIRDSADGGWRVVGCDVNWEDPGMHCCHCNIRIPSAYAED